MATLLDILGGGLAALALTTDTADAADSLLAAGRVARPRVSAQSAVAEVADGTRRARAELRLVRGELTHSCSCRAPRGEGPCSHVAALAFLLTGRGARAAAAPSGTLEDERRRRVERGRSGLFT